MRCASDAETPPDVVTFPAVFLIGILTLFSFRFCVFDENHSAIVSNFHDWLLICCKSTERTIRGFGNVNSIYCLGFLRFNFERFFLVRFWTLDWHFSSPLPCPRCSSHCATLGDKQSSSISRGTKLDIRGFHFSSIRLS